MGEVSHMGTPTHLQKPLCKYEILVSKSYVDMLLFLHLFMLKQYIIYIAITIFLFLKSIYLHATHKSPESICTSSHPQVNHDIYVDNENKLLVN